MAIEATGWAGGAAIVLAGFHVASPLLRRRLTRHEDVVLSIGSGAAAGYVFLELLPELSQGQIRVGHLLGFVMLAGFVVLYAVESWERTYRKAQGQPTSYHFTLGLAWVYSFLIVYGLPESFEKNAPAAALGLTAIAMHLLHTNIRMEVEHPKAFLKRGRYILAGAPLAAGVVDLLDGHPPELYTDLLGAFVAGAILLAVFRDELSDAESRMGAFAVGAAGFAAIVALTVRL